MKADCRVHSREGISEQVWIFPNMCCVAHIFNDSKYLPSVIDTTESRYILPSNNIVTLSVVEDPSMPQEFGDYHQLKISLDRNIKRGEDFFTDYGKFLLSMSCIIVLRTSFVTIIF